MPAPPSLASHWWVSPAGWGAPQGKLLRPPLSPRGPSAPAAPIFRRVRLDAGLTSSGRLSRQTREPGARGSAFLGSVADSVTLGKSCQLGLSFAIRTRESEWEVNLMSRIAPSQLSQREAL